ncbi:ROK family protein [Kordiimonas aestuarii]|uniref:ROK family protein n=1 Tax=Kordiimonas aestuarii TaxID=1005925 RepID=UPI0021D1E8F3|nr:ROK family protein [Kordiimonas aestuarii]
MLAAIEAGGTKFICAVGGAHDDIWAQKTIPTSTPDETLSACARFFQDAQVRFGVITGLGIASFGPLDLTRSATYGSLLATPKSGWAGTNFAHYFGHQVGVRVALDTDVNAAVLAEARVGAARGARDAVYITVGTGIGVGVMSGGQLLHGTLHPELGHMPVPRAHGDEKFESQCPYHSDCVEGLASGPAIAMRASMPASILPSDHLAWQAEAYYLAQLCRTITLAYAPERIIIGGGVMAQKSLIGKVRREAERLIAGYVPVATRSGGMERYIVEPALGKISGLVGAFLLAQQNKPTGGR